MLGFGLEFGMADGFGGEVSFRFLGVTSNEETKKLRELTLVERFGLE